MVDLFLSALALMLVLEGVLPFVNPSLWRKVFERVISLSDGQIRFIGLSSMVIGLIALLLVWP